jgi:3-isopropylmalate dehydrogenase
MFAKIAVLAGDGIGPEVMQQALAVLQQISKKYGHSFETSEGLIGGAAWERYQSHFPDETLELCRQSDAILFGSVGGPVVEAQLEKWKNCERNSILAIRKAFNFYANIRPTLIIPCLAQVSPLKNHLLQNGVDLLVIRELCGDIYFGDHKTFVANNQRCASDVAEYTEDQIVQIAHKAFQIAGNRTRKKVTSVDKANVLDTSRLWREIVTEVASLYPAVSLEHMLVDNCAMQLILNPAQFDVLLTSNLFGDILSDAASAVPGSLGLSASASLNSNGFGMYEPAGGSAPDIAGKNIANPSAQILSLAMLLRLSFGLEEEASAIERAVVSVFEAGFKTKDLCASGEMAVGTVEFGAQVVKNLL